MKRERAQRLSASQKAELWQRWKDGQSLSEIGSALSKHAASIYAMAARRRSRSYVHVACRLLKNELQALRT